MYRENVKREYDIILYPLVSPSTGLRCRLILHVLFFMDFVKLAHGHTGGGVIVMPGQ